MPSLAEALKSASSLSSDAGDSAPSPEPSASDDAFDGVADCLGVPDGKREELKELLRVLILETIDD